MFEKFRDDVSKLPTSSGKTTVNIINNPAINVGVFKEQLNTMANLEDKELYNLIKEFYHVILKDIFKKEGVTYLDMFTTPRFITTLTQVLNSVSLTHDEKVCCNKLAYDYFTLKNNDPYIKELLFILSKMVNRENIQRLLSIGLSESLATYLALARFSDDKECINIKRLNFIIITQPLILMDTQMIVYIYEKLFDSVGTLTSTVMFDVYNEEDEWVTEEIMEVYSNVSNAVLAILNNLPSMYIKKILVTYTNDFEMMHRGDNRQIRFSMNSLSQDYSRILDMVEMLKGERIYVP